MTSPAEWILLLLGAGFASHLLMPVVRRLAASWDLVDHPSWRRNQKAAVPCSGGIAIYLAVAAGAVLLSTQVGLPFAERSLWALGIAGLGIIVLGVVDDRFGLHAEKKLLGQILIVSLPMASGLNLESLTLPGLGTFQLGLLAGPVTLFWYLGFINSINLIDGLDGLAAGIVCGVLAALLVVLQPGDATGAVWTLLYLGAVGGFLRNNLSRRRIFLGDAGSMLLGLWLAGWTLGLAPRTPTVPVMAVAAMAVPILDTTTTILRRRRRGISVFRADAEHLHHRLLRLGSTPRRAVASLWFLTLAAASLGAMVTGTPGAGILALGALAAAAIDLAYMLPASGRPTAADAVLYLLGIRATVVPPADTGLAEVIEMQPYQRGRRAPATREAAPAAEAPPVAESAPGAKVGAAAEGSEDVVLALPEKPH